MNLRRDQSPTSWTAELLLSDLDPLTTLMIRTCPELLWVGNRCRCRRLDQYVSPGEVATVPCDVGLTLERKPLEPEVAAAAVVRAVREYVADETSGNVDDQNGLDTRVLRTISGAP